MRMGIVLGVAALLTASVQAQPPGGQGGPGGPPPPFGGPGGGPPPLSPALVPGELLQSYLALTPEQVQKLKALNDDLQRNRPRPPQQGGSMPSQAEMQKRRKAMDTGIAAANKKLDALLTVPQKTKLKTLMKAMAGLQQQHVPPFALRELKLTSAQVEKLAAGKDALTAAQKQQLEAHRPPFGGPDR